MLPLLGMAASMFGGGGGGAGGIGSMLGGSPLATSATGPVTVSTGVKPAYILSAVGVVVVAVVVVVVFRKRRK